MWTNNSRSKPPTGQTKRTSSIGKRSVESRTGKRINGHDGGKRPSNSSKQLSTGQPDEEGIQHWQAISTELGGQQHAPIDTTDVNKQQQRATGQQDGKGQLSQARESDQ
jgi:hypothetical protein